ncbi:40S ribosomal protein S21 [Oopsacas minuta]|uniref:40S ribosomal protein S21 n=1 Tax=Oopsacas minuta TaxID=111878 RepID=A0AAV7K8N9_9METZ|nr:40S ribosomal protein S21 [Oopsacas minuta]
MQNDAGVNVELYFPRKCSFTNRLITAKDHAAVQLSVAELDQEGKMIGAKKYVISGYLRKVGEADSALNYLTCRDGISTDIAKVGKKK